MITPIHEEQKVQLVPAKLSFEGSSVLPQFMVRKVSFAKQELNSQINVKIVLDRICSYHFFNTFIPTTRFNNYLFPNDIIFSFKQIESLFFVIKK